MSNRQRVARLLKEGFQAWSNAHGGANLHQFSKRQRINYKLLSRWMNEGTTYPHEKTEGKLRRLCTELGVNWGDLWAEPTVTLPIETMTEVIGLLAKVQALLKRSLDEARGIEGKEPSWGQAHETVGHRIEWRVLDAQQGKGNPDDIRLEELVSKWGTNWPTYRTMEKVRTGLRFLSAIDAALDEWLKKAPQK